LLSAWTARASFLLVQVADTTVWTIPALSILAPAVRAAMNDLQQPPTLPANASFFLGQYYDGSVTVRFLVRRSLSPCRFADDATPRPTPQTTANGVSIHACGLSR
jgi:hypothetical protein